MSKTKISQYKRTINKFRYGLVLQSIRNMLTKIGIVITPYYWIKENIPYTAIPEIKGSISEYSVEFLEEKDMRVLSENARGYSEAEFMTRLRDGNLCLGLKHNDEVVTFMWIFLKRCDFMPVNIPLKRNEVYVSDMYTMEPYRGKNLAVYLRYRSYPIIREMGRDTIFSVTEYFNTSAMKYKKKLNPTNLNLVLYIKLFNKFKWSCIIKTY